MYAASTLKLDGGDTSGMRCKHSKTGRWGHLRNETNSSPLTGSLSLIHVHGNVTAELWGHTDDALCGVVSLQIKQSPIISRRR